MADKFCGNCGTPNPETSKFCISCGSPLAAAAPASQPIEQPVTPVEHPFSQPQQQPYPEYPPQPQPFQGQTYQQPSPMAPTLPKKKNHKGLLLLGAAALLLIIVIAVSLGGTAKADYYKAGGDRVPSVKLALGEKRTVTGTSKSVANGVTSLKITYKSLSQYEDVNAYVAYLESRDGFSFQSDASGNEFFGRDSKKGGSMVLVSITSNADGYTVTVESLKGSFAAFVRQ